MIRPSKMNERLLGVILLVFHVLPKKKCKKYSTKI